eukprot:TRINITY_DN1740_c0_g1_i24.p2 TRINITY_DN1740_c0_g1~~TRINITY_DN1740_c0_g1_i24.p2  ORF type:complete len:132 (-),score=25.41 TRINITY_DN1740_c0_g1_i24:877-1272(-)
MAGMEETGGTDGEQAYRGEDGEVTVRLARVADIAMAGELTTMVNEAYREGYVGILEEPSAYTRLDEAEMRDRISAVPSRKVTLADLLMTLAEWLIASLADCDHEGYTLLDLGGSCQPAGGLCECHRSLGFG